MGENNFLYLYCSIQFQRSQGGHSRGAKAQQGGVGGRLTAPLVPLNAYTMHI